MNNHVLEQNPTTAPERRWVTASELAELYGISVYSVRRAVRTRRLRTREVMPGLVRIDLKSVPDGRHSVERRAR